MSTRYKGDPYWTTARYNSTTKDGTLVKKGDRIFYYPKCKTVLVGAAAEAASAEFQSAAQDEDQYMAGYGSSGYSDCSEGNGGNW